MNTGQHTPAHDHATDRRPTLVTSDRDERAPDRASIDAHNRTREGTWWPSRLATLKTSEVGHRRSVTLDDAPPDATAKLPGYPEPQPDYLVIHQQDLQAVVNALWQGGADGIKVMDQRLISTSAVRRVGNTLILQGRVYSPPYKIRRSVIRSG
ncbi:hypothetical protein SVIOM342S_02669 [Streptomyces violaceorubidus]